MKKSKKPKSPVSSAGWSKHFLNLILLAGLLGLIIYTYSCPLAVGKAILIKKTVYVRDVQAIKFILYLMGGLGISVFIYSLVSNRFFWPGMVLMVSGGVPILLYFYTRKQIEENAVSFLGIDPLTIISTRPDIGLSFLMLIGVIMILTGFIYLIESFISRSSRH